MSEQSEINEDFIHNKYGYCYKDYLGAEAASWPDL